jgi:hypothetical protein
MLAQAIPQQRIRNTGGEESFLYSRNPRSLKIAKFVACLPDLKKCLMNNLPDLEK